MTIKFDVKTGLVFLRNYDLGIQETLGAVLMTDPNTGFPRYFINISGVCPENVPILFNEPLPSTNPKYIPSFVINREDANPALQRWHSIGANQYRVPAPDAHFMNVILQNGDVVSGYDAYEQLPQAFPFDIFYTITIYARYERDAIPMLHHVLKIFKPISQVIISDSECAVRTYTVFNENGFSDISEIVDIVDRKQVYSVQIKIEGELDLSEPEINNTVLEIIGRTETL